MLANYPHPPPQSTANKDSEGKEKAKQNQTPASSIDTILFLFFYYLVKQHIYFILSVHNKLMSKSKCLVCLGHLHLYLSAHWHAYKTLRLPRADSDKATILVENQFPIGKPVPYWESWKIFSESGNRGGGTTVGACVWLSWGLATAGGMATAIRLEFSHEWWDEVSGGGEERRGEILK